MRSSHKFGRNKQVNVTPFRGQVRVPSLDEFIELCERKTEILEIDRELKMVCIVSVCYYMIVRPFFSISLFCLEFKINEIYVFKHSVNV